MDLDVSLCMQHADLASLRDSKQQLLVVDEALINGTGRASRRQGSQGPVKGCPKFRCGCGGSRGRGRRQQAHVVAAVAAEQQQWWPPWSRCCGRGRPKA